jgi:hypothetical protein
MTDRVQDLARRFGLKTAAEIAPPDEADPPASGAAEWTPAKSAAFRELGPVAVYVAGNISGPEPRYFGDNRGAWPILLGIVRSWRDSVTPHMDRLSPIRARGVLFRVWTPSSADAHRLMAAIEGLVRDRVEQMRGNWLDFGPDTDARLFETEVHALAARIGIAPTWDDEDLSAVLDRKVIERAAAAKGWGKGRVGK